MVNPIVTTISVMDTSSISETRDLSALSIVGPEEVWKTKDGIYFYCAALSDVFRDQVKERGGLAFRIIQTNGDTLFECRFSTLDGERDLASLQLACSVFHDGSPEPNRP